MCCSNRDTTKCIISILNCYSQMKVLRFLRSIYGPETDSWLGNREDLRVDSLTLLIIRDFLYNVFG